MIVRIFRVIDTWRISHITCFIWCQHCTDINLALKRCCSSGFSLLDARLVRITIFSTRFFLFLRESRSEIAAQFASRKNRLHWKSFLSCSPVRERRRRFISPTTSSVRSAFSLVNSADVGNRRNGNSRRFRRSDVVPQKSVYLVWPSEIELAFAVRMRAYEIATSRSDPLPRLSFRENRHLMRKIFYLYKR